MFCLIFLCFFITQISSSNNAPEQQDPIAVIGGGISGLSAACELRKLGYKVILLEKQPKIGGRLQIYQESGYTFDMGPSWYWMPELFEKFFERFGKNVSDYYNITLLEPAYRIFFEKEMVDVPGTYEGLVDYYAAKNLSKADLTTFKLFIEEAKFKYTKGIYEWIWKPALSILEFVEYELMISTFNLNMFNGLAKHVDEYVKDPIMRIILKWPVIFIGISPEEAPAMYSLMSFAGHGLGSWYPDGGMTSIVNSMAKIAQEMGATIKVSQEVDKLEISSDRDDPRVSAVCSQGKCMNVSGVVLSGDYHHLESLFPPHLRNYEETFWDEQVLSPSCILFFVGLKERIPQLLHHTFFFEYLQDALDDAFIRHAFPSKIAFYISATSRTDSSVAPSQSHETLFILIPVSYKLNGTDFYTDILLDIVFGIMENRLQLEKGKLRKTVEIVRPYSPDNFEQDYHSFRGNAFGLANTLSQSLIWKPSMQSKCKNAVFVGHLTNPGPGMPPALVSGIVGANLLHESLTHVPEFCFTCYLRTIIPFLNFFLYSIIAAHMFLALAYVLSKRVRSRLYCIQLMYIHGRTYFAASTLMQFTPFIDTATLYALFRVTDDLVDTTEETRKRTVAFESFKKQFWVCWENGTGDYAMHPILPAVIETVKRLKFSEDLFISFFNSMEMDLKEESVYSDLDSTILYMEGSAAVIGEFMLPVLVPNADDEEMAKLKKSARDLGYAFQLTNFLRDIGEDLIIGRQYIPQDICDKHDVDLNRMDSTQPGFTNLMEEMFGVADAYYQSADNGITQLPGEVGKLIKVARYVYHELHDVIRKNDYQIFNEKVRVPFLTKIQIAWPYVSILSILRIIAIEAYFKFIFLIFPIFLTLSGTAFIIRQVKIVNCSYALFLLVFIISPLVIIWSYAFIKRKLSHVLNVVKCTLLLCILALIYTTPWDNYLVYIGIWSYPMNRIISIIGLVPIEEYSFFVLETTLVCGFWLFFFPSPLELISPPSFSRPLPILPSILSNYEKREYLTRVVMAIFGCLEVLALILFCYGKHVLYCGLIMGWAIPILALQWWFGSHALIAHKKRIIKCIVLISSYLCLVDRWAIKNGIWFISSNFSIFNILSNLPFEEALFFLLTVTICVCGLTLFTLALTHNMRRPHLSLIEACKEIIYWCQDKDKHLSKFFELQNKQQTKKPCFSKKEKILKLRHDRRQIIQIFLAIPFILLPIYSTFFSAPISSDTCVTFSDLVIVLTFALILVLNMKNPLSDTHSMPPYFVLSFALSFGILYFPLDFILILLCLVIYCFGFLLNKNNQEESNQKERNESEEERENGEGKESNFMNSLCDSTLNIIQGGALLNLFWFHPYEMVKLLHFIFTQSDDIIWIMNILFYLRFFHLVLVVGALVYYLWKRQLSRILKITCVHALFILSPSIFWSTYIILIFLSTQSISKLVI